MSEIISRLDKLNEWKKQFKHLRGRHDQRDHNRWPAGYQAQVYVPTGRRGSALSARTSGGLRSMTRSGILASRTTIADVTVEQMKTAMNDTSVRPSPLLMARWLVGRGSKVRFNETDVKEGRISAADLKKLEAYSTPTRWEKGELFFRDIPRTTGPVDFGVISKKPAYWQRSYVAALREYTRQGKSEAEAQIEAGNYADHIDFLMSEDSPMRIARNLSSMGWIQQMLSVVPEVGHSAAKHDATADTLYGLRRVLGTVRDMWEKYKGGDVADAEPYFSDMFRESVEGRGKLTYDDLSLEIETALRTGKDSIFGYLSSQFPEMRANTFDVLKQVANGYGVTRLPDAMLRNPLDTQRMSELATPYDSVAATTPSQYKKDEFYSVAGLPGVVLPKSSVDFANAIDPDNNATYVQTVGRTEVDDAMIEQVMNRARMISQETGIPIEVVTSVLSYWQNGTQMIDGYPVPTLVRLQQAAADLFGLELGPDGQQLNEYQQMLLDEADRIAAGGPTGSQWRSDTSDVNQRTNAPIEHLFNDVFARDFNATDMEELQYLFMNDKTSDNFPQKYLLMSDEQIDIEYPRTSKKRKDEMKAERDKKTKAELDEVQRAYDEFTKQRALEEANTRIVNTGGVPATPYNSPQEARKALLRHIYAETQRLLREKGVGPTTFYRGVSLTRNQVDALQDKIRKETGNESFSLFTSDGEFNPQALVGLDVVLPRNALESWTTDLLVADSIGANIDAGVNVSYEEGASKPIVKDEPIIAEIVLGGTFDPSRIVSTPATGFGQYREGEVVLTGNRDEPLKVMAASPRTGKVGKLTKYDGSEKEIRNKLSERVRRGEGSYYYNGWGYGDAASEVSARVRQGIVEARTLLIRYFKSLGYN